MFQRVRWLQVKTSRTFLRDCTVVSPMALLLFGGALSVVHESGYVLVDDWLRIRASAPTAVLVKRLRGALDALLADKVRRARPCMGKEQSRAVSEGARCNLRSSAVTTLTDEVRGADEVRGTIWDSA